MLNWSDFQRWPILNDSIHDQLQRLQSLYSEQDYTIQTLNDTVARQDRELLRLQRDIEHLKKQLQNLKTDVGSDISPQHEKPPHY